MLKQLLLNDIIKLFDKRDKRIKELKQNKDLADPNVQKEITKILNDENIPVNLYLEEDAYLLNGGGFKKGKKLLPDDIKKLYGLGFQMLWVTDKYYTEDDLKKNLQYVAKSEFLNILGKCMIQINEEEGKKSPTSIKILNGDDLLRQTIEPLQYDGAMYCFRNIFGDQNKKIINLKPFIRGITKKHSLNKINFCDNLTIGNPVILRNKKKQSNGEEDTKDEKVFTNLPLLYMINMGLAYLVTLNNINAKRLEIDPNDTLEKGRRIDPEKRHGYDPDPLCDYITASFFMDFGYIHSVIMNSVYQNTFSFFDSKGQFTNDEDGYLELDERITTIIDKHCNVSYHLFAWMKEKPLIFQPALDILQYHMRGINGYGYPKRKTVEEKVKFQDQFGNTSNTIETRFDSEISEPVRLAMIVSFFVEYLYPTPFALPFGRDNLIRHMLLNSEWRKTPDGTDDLNGQWELNTKEKYKKRFDGYLVTEFLKSIDVFKIGEQVPIYSFLNSKEPVYHGTVISYNEMPHRPVVEICKDGANIQLDLSSSDNDKLYIGEYNPSLRFMDVVKEFHEDRTEVYGVYLKDQAGYRPKAEMKLRPNAEENLKSTVDELFEQPKVDPAINPNEEVDVDSLIAASIPKALKKDNNK